MAKLIMLEDAIEIAEGYARSRLKMHDWSGQAVAEDIVEELKNLPTVEAVVMSNRRVSDDERKST